MKEILMDAMEFLPEIIGGIFFVVVYLFVKPKGSKTRIEATQEKIQKYVKKGKKALENADKYAAKVTELKKELQENEKNITSL